MAWLDRAGHEDDYNPAGLEALEAMAFAGHRWWNVDELLASDERVLPYRLREFLPDLVAGIDPRRTRRHHPPRSTLVNPLPRRSRPTPPTCSGKRAVARVSAAGSIGWGGWSEASGAVEQGLEAVEGRADIVGTHGKEQRGDLVDAGLGVLLDHLRRTRVEVRTRRDREVGA